MCTLPSTASNPGTFGLCGNVFFCPSTISHLASKQLIITHPRVSPEFPPTKQHIGNNSATRETSLSQRKPTAASCPSKSQKSYAGLSTDKFHPPFRKIFLIERLGLLLPITHVIPSLHWFAANSLIWLSQNISNCHIGIYLGYSPTGASIAAAVRMVPFAAMHIDAIYKR